MKKITFLTVALLACMFTFAQTASVSNASADPTAKLVEFKNAEYDMGKITLGQAQTYEVEIKNISSDSVTLVAVSPSCGCTAPDFKANEKFGPGQVSKITFHYNGATAGKFTKFATIYFNGGLSKQVSFSGEGVQDTPPPTAAITPTQVQKVKPASNR